MRELVYYVAVSIDGYIAAPDGSYDAFPIEGDHMAVYLSDFADALPSHVLAALGVQPPGNRFDTVIQGRASYDVARAAGIERPYAHLSEFVATRSEAASPDGADVFLNHDARLEASTTHQIKVLHDGPSGTTSISISEPLVVEGANATSEPQAGHRR